MSSIAAISLGSNLGDRRAILDAAVEGLRATAGVEVLAVSSYHETVPVGGPSGQGAFLNAAAVLWTSLRPHELAAVLLRLERDAGRVRQIRWDERTLDLDLLLYDDLVLETPDLTIPHPRMAFRRFVLAPLEEIAPGTIDPLTGRTVRKSLANLDRRPSFVCLVEQAGSRSSVHERILQDPQARELFDPDNPARWFLERFVIQDNETSWPDRFRRESAVQTLPTFFVATDHFALLALRSAPINDPTRLRAVPILHAGDHASPDQVVTETLAACKASRPD